MRIAVIGAVVASCAAACFSEDPYAPPDAGGADVTNPAVVGGVSVVPAVLKKGAVAIVSFTVSEELGEEPSVTLEAVHEQRTLANDPKRSKGLNHVFTYAADGSEVQGIDAPVKIALVDMAGLAGNDTSASMQFDFTAPVADAPAVTPAAAAPGDVVTVTFKTSEPLAADPVVTLGTGAMAKSGLTDGVYTFTRAVAADDGTGAVQVSAELIDAAFNTARVDLGTVTITP